MSEVERFPQIINHLLVYIRLTQHVIPLQFSTLIVYFALTKGEEGKAEYKTHCQTLK